VGWQQGTLDDASFLGSAINFGLWDAAELIGLVFHRKKGYITSWSMCAYNSPFYIGFGGQQWMDGNGWCQMTLPVLEIPNPVGFG
jgi:hypothetical protein